MAEQAGGRVRRRVIADLQAMKDSLQSADDSGLKNVWDEICVQVQRDHGSLWDLYVDAIDTHVKGHLNGLHHHERAAIWLMTDSGNGWSESEIHLAEQQFIVVSDLVQHLRSLVLEAAGRWQNKQIRDYLDRW